MNKYKGMEKTFSDKELERMLSIANKEADLFMRLADEAKVKRKEEIYQREFNRWAKTIKSLEKEIEERKS